MTACGRTASPPTAGGRVQIDVAPLTLAGVGDAAYTLTVSNAQGDVVWTRSGLRSSAYGDGAGALAYVGTCDADQNPNHVDLTLTDLYDDGGTPLAGWLSPGTVRQDATCRADQDVAVAFDLTIARAAEQGFADIAVSFSDIFCSAKLDCSDAFLHDDGGQRAPTAVVAFACTVGQGGSTYLHMNDIHITCADGASVWVAPGGEGGAPGNMGAHLPQLFQTAAYWGREGFGAYDKCYWNVALGLADLGPSCVLDASATATDAPLDADGALDAGTYPYVRWTVPLTNSEGARVCTLHPLDQPGSGVATAYLPATAAVFESSLACEDPPAIASAPRALCAGTIGDLGALIPVSERATVGGVSVRVGDERSTSYLLPAGYSVDGCCLNPCCTDP